MLKRKARKVCRQDSLSARREKFDKLIERVLTVKTVDERQRLRLDLDETFSSTWVAIADAVGRIVLEDNARAA